MHRFATATATAIALLAAAALAGCAATAAPNSPAVVTAASTAPGTAGSAAASSSPTTGVGGDTADPSPAAGLPTADASPASALAQHVFDECSTGAPEAGVRLVLSADPSGYSDADGHQQLIYPFEFLDGHDDPYAVYNCTLSDDSVTSRFIGGGLSDAH